MTYPKSPDCETQLTPMLYALDLSPSSLVGEFILTCMYPPFLLPTSVLLSLLTHSQQVINIFLPSFILK